VLDWPMAAHGDRLPSGGNVIVVAYPAEIE
jgi:hypothetical protein